jgi:hypothetical protein
MLWYILAAVFVVCAIVLRNRANKAFTTPIDKVHAGKKDTHKFKFDVDVVRARATRKGLRTPAIDLSNLPPQNPRVVALLQAVLTGNLEKSIKELSGEVDVTVNGTTSRILSRSTHSKGVEVAMQYLEEFYKKLGIPTQRIKYTVRGKTFYNLEATILGSVSPDKVIVVGSHLDSTAGDTWRSEPRAPGADDDASGTVANMELGKALVSAKAAGAVLGCTIRLLHFTGEEQGLWGSYTYSDKCAKEGVNIIAMLQMDMIGYCAKPGNRLDLHDDVDRNGAHKLTVLFFRNVARYALNLTPFDTHDNAVHDRSDHAGFADHGVCALCISEEFTEGPGGGFNPHYHSVQDDYKSVNFPYMAEVVKLLIASVADLADLK